MGALKGVGICSRLLQVLCWVDWVARICSLRLSVRKSSSRAGHIFLICWAPMLGSHSYVVLLRHAFSRLAYSLGLPLSYCEPIQCGSPSVPLADLVRELCANFVALCGTLCGRVVQLATLSASYCIGVT